MYRFVIKEEQEWNIRAGKFFSHWRLELEYDGKTVHSHPGRFKSSGDCEAFIKEKVTSAPIVVLSYQETGV